MDSQGKVKVKRPSGFFKLGNTYCLSIQGEIYVSIGPDWGFNLCLGLIILFANIFYLLIMAPRVGQPMQSIGFAIYFGSLLCYLLTALKNPGIIQAPWEVELEAGEAKSSVCTACSVMLEPDSEHCYDCQVCVRGYDHHCPLSGKCIGSGNIIPFYGFLVSVFAGILYFGVWFFIISKSVN
jgi:hypothetical protein